MTLAVIALAAALYFAWALVKAASAFDQAFDVDYQESENMKHHNYTEFDKELMTLVENGKKTFNELAFLMDGHAMKFCDETSEPFRVVDRRLQALRKSGKLTFNRSKKEWEVSAKGGA